MNAAAFLWKSLLDLARRPMPAPGAASQPKQMWLELDWDCLADEQKRLLEAEADVSA